VLFAAGLVVSAALKGPSTAGDFVYGLLVLLGIVYAATFLGLCMVRTHRAIVGLITVLLLALFVDVATNTYVQTKSRWPKAYALDETPADDNVGLRYFRTDIHTGYYTEFLVSYKSLVELNNAGLNAAAIPYLKVFTKAHNFESAAAERKLIEQAGGYERYDSLGIRSASGGTNELAEYLNPTNSLGQPKVTVDRARRTYNSLSFEVTASEKCLVFIRDAYSPYWTARVNGSPKPLYRALSNFKALSIPRGTSQVLLTFTPRGISWLLPLALSVFWGTVIAGGWLVFRRKRRGSSPGTSTS
jgi:hypothetical protein